MGLFPADLQNVSKKLSNLQSDLNARSLNILKLGFDIKQDGSNTSESLQAALNYCAENSYSAFIPAGTYTVGRQNNDNTVCITLPDNLCCYIETGAIFKLYDNAPSWTRVIGCGDNVKVYGTLEIDGNKDTVTDGNEHMAGLFLLGSKNVYIESVNSYDCYGDCVQLSGEDNDENTLVNVTQNIVIDRIVSSNAGRNALTIETVDNLHLKSVHLKSEKGLDIEPYSLSTNYIHSVKIDYLISEGKDDFSVGENKESYFQVTIDYYQTKEVLSYSITMNIGTMIIKPDTTITSESFIISYSAIWNIQNLSVYIYKNTAISLTNSANTQPKLHVQKLEAFGGGSTYDSKLLYMSGGICRIDNLYGDNIINSLGVDDPIIKFDATAIEFEVSIKNMYFKNCGATDQSIITLTSVGSDTKPNLHFQNISVIDSRETKTESIIKIATTIMRDALVVNNISNPDSVTEFTTRYGNFTVFIKTCNTGIPIYIGYESPIDNLIAPIGSMVLNRNGASGTTLFVKESGTDANGWVAK